MKCVFPPELDEKSLWNYVDKEADQDVGYHLENCEYCRERASELSQLRDQVRSRLYRITCPPASELGEYYLHLLPASRSLVVAQHIRQCSLCTKELAQLEQYLSQPVPQGGFIGQINTIIARLVNGSEFDQSVGESSSIPAYTSLRGAEDEPFIYQADHIQISIEVQDDLEQLGRKMLLGLITGLKSNGFMMEVYQEGNLVATTFVDEIGNFIFSHLSPGTYELILLGPDTEIRIQSFIV